MAADISGEDAMEFYLNGDAAPGGSFTFVSDTTGKGETEAEQNRMTVPFFSGLFNKTDSFFDSIIIFCRKIIAYIKYV